MVFKRLVSIWPTPKNSAWGRETGGGGERARQGSRLPDRHPDECWLASSLQLAVGENTCGRESPELRFPKPTMLQILHLKVPRATHLQPAPTSSRWQGSIRSPNVLMEEPRWPTCEVLGRLCSHLKEVTPRCFTYKLSKIYILMRCMQGPQILGLERTNFRYNL